MDRVRNLDSACVLDPGSCLLAMWPRVAYLLTLVFHLQKGEDTDLIGLFQGWNEKKCLLNTVPDPGSTPILVHLFIFNRHWPWKGLEPMRDEVRFPLATSGRVTGCRSFCPEGSERTGWFRQEGVKSSLEKEVWAAKGTWEVLGLPEIGERSWVICRARTVSKGI